MIYAETPDGRLHCSRHDATMAKGRACAACAIEAIDEDATPQPGVYESLTDSAESRGLPDRLEAEASMWDGHRRLMGLADELTELADAIKAERALGVAGGIARSRSWRSVLELRIKAIAEAGKFARGAADLLLWRERMSEAEKADRLYADRQRRVARRPGVH